MRVNGDHRIHLVNKYILIAGERSWLDGRRCERKRVWERHVYMGICTKLEASLTNKVLIWINCWISSLPPTPPAIPVQSDSVIWVLMIELQIGIAVEVWMVSLDMVGTKAWSGHRRDFTGYRLGTSRYDTIETWNSGV